MKRFNPLKAVDPAAAPLTAPRKAPPAEPHDAEFTVTLTLNRQKNGLELRFPRKPDEHTLAMLKARNWRWSRFSSCWWHRDTPEERVWAQRFMKAPVTLPPPATPPTAASYAVSMPSTPSVPALNILTVNFGTTESFTPEIK